MLKCDDYSAVIVKWFTCNGLRANDYSAVMLKSKQHNDMPKIGQILGGGRNVCALRVRHQGAAIPHNRVFRITQFSEH
jgi:hypothetical protein